MTGTWDDGLRAWERLIRAFAGGRPRDGEAALRALADIGLLRRLLDQAETVAVPSARRAGRSWAEIAARLGVTRQSAWEKWRQMDDGATGVLARAARARVEEVAGSDTCAVPDVVGGAGDREPRRPRPTPKSGIELG